jgi:acetylornithine deacetylase/succinyl-diaminopimelate desuccinylase-like protein
MDSSKLLKQLVNLSSYVDKNHNEKAVADFIYKYLTDIPSLTTERQLVSAGRYNIFARGSGTTRLLIAGHMDTVEPKRDSPSKASIGGDKLSGLGSLDTKGGMASLLLSIRQAESLANKSFLFYCDEEYDFKGMRAFLKNNTTIKPELSIVIEPTQLKIQNGHRGLIEVYISILGKSGHAARPEHKDGAGWEMNRFLQTLRNELDKYSNPGLGTPSLNIAYQRTGTFRGYDGTQAIITGQGNNIADFAEIILDIRTTHKKLRANVIKKITAKFFRNRNKLHKFEVRHDLGPLYTEKNKIKSIENLLIKAGQKVEYLDPQGMGYGDGQLINEKTGCPVIYLGPKGEGMHASNEYVSIKSLDKLSHIFDTILDKF